MRYAIIRRVRIDKWAHHKCWFVKSEGRDDKWYVSRCIRLNGGVVVVERPEGKRSNLCRSTYKDSPEDYTWEDIETEREWLNTLFIEAL